MCRFLAYTGATTTMQELLFDSSYSLVNQSKNARMRFEPVNGDGFGVGWYPEKDDPVPGTFVSIEPAWSNRNLRELSAKIPTRHFFAHVRDASTGMPVSQANCHPFKYKNYLWMHNGFLGDFRQSRRALLNSLSDASFNMIDGNTDSEHAFAIFIDELNGDATPGTHQNQTNSVDSNQLFQALSRAIARIIDLREASACESAAHMNFAVSNGQHSLYTRFCDSKDTPPPTLHYLQKNDAFIVASEPLSENEAWQELENRQVLIVEHDRKMAIRNLDL